MPVQKVFAFGCEDAAFLTPGNPPTYVDILGVQEAEFSCEHEKTEVKGDDDVLTTWLHSQKASLKLSQGVIDPDVFETITGNTVSSGGSPQQDEILLGTDEELEGTEFALRLKLKAKDAEGSGDKKTVWLFVYNCVGSVKLTGMKQGEAVGVAVEADCFRASTDEMGASLSSPARAKLVVSGN